MMARTYQNVNIIRRFFGFQCSQNTLIGKKQSISNIYKTKSVFHPIKVIDVVHYKHSKQKYYM